MNIILLKPEHHIIHKWVSGGGGWEVFLFALIEGCYWGLTSKRISWAERWSFCSYQGRGGIRQNPQDDWSSLGLTPCWILMKHRLCKLQASPENPLQSSSGQTTGNCAVFDQVIKITITQAKPLGVCAFWERVGSMLHASLNGRPRELSTAFLLLGWVAALGRFSVWLYISSLAIWFNE